MRREHGNRGRQVERMNTNIWQNTERDLGKKNILKKEVKRKEEKRESCRNRGSGKD